MRVAVLGAGPAGLYFSYVLKRLRPETEIRVFEQNPPDATFGFGVVFSDRALEFLREDDPETCELIAPAMESWSDVTLHHRGESIRIDGVGFSAIGRLALLRLLQARARSVGIEPRYRCAIGSVAELGEADLVVGADGVHSLVRRSLEPELGASVMHLANRFAWYGTTRVFETLSQTFVEDDLGVFNAHHYRYSPEMSTFIVETDAATWERAGFARMTEEESAARCERLFEATLDGHRLISNRSVWRTFPRVRNERWSTGTTVLIGDALHTAHFSIGSGTRLAMEDAIALVKALEAHPRDVREALGAYEAARRPIVEKLVAAADASATWYERFAEHMRLAPLEFAMSYITRSARVDLARLRERSPRFMAAYDGRQASPA
jgi:2-polyprenyl-6-methoxyphenol hydroxylase-like FAD-dependent oxidoreductase